MSDRKLHSPDALFSRLAHSCNRVFARVFHQLEVIRPSKIPDGQPGLLICNHIAGLDPSLIQSVVRPLIVWMMVREFYDITYINGFLKNLGAIPVDRNGRDTTGLRAAFRALDANRLVGVFPEGGIEKEAKLEPFQPGVAMMALKKRVPIYPVCIEGTQRGQHVLAAYINPNKARIAFGEPVKLDDLKNSRNDQQTATKRMEEAVARLWDLVHFDSSR